MKGGSGLAEIYALLSSLSPADMADGLETPLPVSSDGPSASEPRLSNWVDCMGLELFSNPTKLKRNQFPGWVVPGVLWLHQSQGKGRQERCTFLTLENLWQA